MMEAIFSFNTLIILGALISAACAVFFKKPLSSVIALGVTGAFLSLEFIVLHAPDVAIAEAAVGAVLSTVIFVVAVKKTTKKEDEEQ